MTIKGFAAIRLICIGVLVPLLPGSTEAQEVRPAAGMVITASTALRPGTYDLPAPKDSGAALIVIRGSNIDVDLRGVTLRGAPAGADPDAGAGIAILVDGGENVTVRNARIRGYKIAILARGTRNLRLLDNDLSHNWKPRLYSIVEHESLADWLSFHQNEKREWMRHGAAIYLEDVRAGEVRGNTVRQGMNGLLMTRTDSLLVWNNDFSFNSGLGIGMYRSDHNRIMHNRVDYNVRGYSEGFYRRGQDSAGILIYEQSDSNVVAYNSATHGGDGLFLWAGQHTMDTGQGGANDNLFYRNDFSWAPTNGMEATFSRNQFVENRIVGSDHGLWGGYSFNSLVLRNHFEGNRVGIALEHGQSNTIVGNRFLDDVTAIFLWANKIEPSDWGYPKHRDTRSHGYLIANNEIRPRQVAFRIGDTRDSRLIGNTVRADTVMIARGDTAGIAVAPDQALDPMLVPVVTEPAPLPGRINALPSAYERWPRSTIVVDEWGPYDWSHPKLWPVDSSLSTPLKLRVLGPGMALGTGRSALGWRVARIRGATVDKRSGRFGDTITVRPNSGQVEDWRLEIEAESRERRAVYSRFDPRARWDVRVFAWDSTAHPIERPEGFAAVLRGERGAPVFREATGRLDYMWYRPPARLQGWPQDRAAVVATTRVNLPRGAYRIRTISDDGIRVYVDGKLVIEDWSVHESRIHEAPLSGGAHDVRVEYFQRDGWSELRVEILKR